MFIPKKPVVPKPTGPNLQKLLEHMREGDTVVIWKLDRLGRSLPHLVELVSSWRAGVSA